MINNLQLNHLRTLIAIADKGGFTAAGEHMGRTQSAITQQMHSLEEVVGSPLFRKRGRKRELTEEGLSLLQNSREIIARCNHAIAAANKGAKADFITLGAPLEVAEDLLPPVISAYARKWPNVRLDIRVARSPDLMEMLESGQLDMTLSTRRTDAYHSAFLIKRSVHWIARENWVPDMSRPLPLVLSDEPSMFRRIALSALDLSGHSYSERVTSPSLAGIRLAVAAGIGVTVRIKSRLFGNTTILTEQDGLPPLPDVHYYLHRSAVDPAPHIRDMFDLIVEHLREE